MTSVGAPVAALASELKLSDKQQQQIKQIQDKFRKDMAGAMPGGGPPMMAGGPNAGRGGAGRMGGPGGMGGGQVDVQKLQTLSKSASASIEAALTPAQRKDLPRAMKEIGSLRSAGIPLETVGQLKLTSSQKSKIVTIADRSQKDAESKIKAANGDFQSLRPILQQSREKTHADAMALLTASQKGIVDKYEKDHPRRGFGGGGRFGGGRGGPGGAGAPMRRTGAAGA